MEDIQIIDLYFARNENAIMHTKERYGPLCFSIARGILHSDPDAEECENDTYLTLWNIIPPQRPNALRAFICRITRNLALKRYAYLSAQKRSREVEISLSELEAVLPDERLSRPMEEQQLGKLISDFLRQQKKDVRAVFIRKYWFFDSVEEIGRRFGFSQSKVKSMLFHTRSRLRAYLEREGICL